MNNRERTFSDLAQGDEFTKLENIENIKILGNGKHSVYLYYYPQYRDLDMSMWPCKIGMTKRNVSLRVLEQSKTALPEKPKIALIIKTNHAYDLEQILHHLLNLYDRKCRTAEGSEWYYTSPDEIISICQIMRLS